MKKIIAISVFLISIFVLHSQTFTNWNFEQWTGDNPFGWTLAPTSSRVSFSKSGLGEGRGDSGYALIITANSNASGADGEFEATITNITPSQNITLSIYTKQGTVDGNMLWIRYWDCRFFNSEDVQVGVDYDENAYSSGDNSDWLKYQSQQLLAPDNAVKLRVNFRIYIQSDFLAGDIIYVDDLMINDTPLPVTLSSFTASYSKNAAVLNWVTQSETDNLGFNLFRSESEHGYPNGAYLSLNSTLIEGNGTTTEPTFYSFTDEYPVIEGHTYWYWLQSVSTTNKLELFGPVSLEIPSAGQLPTMTVLSSIYPNPFNPETTIDFNVKENETGVLIIYNLRGERILKESFETGNHQYHWNAEGLASGIYFYKLSSPTTNITKKMILMK